MNNDTQSKIGNTLGEGERRDAVHIAVAPVIAVGQLSPGQRVGFVKGDTEYVGDSPNPIGIVDPFLRGDVWDGARFWLFLFPNTITGLRHTWAHPAFGNVPDDKGESRAWIEAFAADLDQTYNRLMDAARQYAEDGDWTYDNTETYKDHYDKWPIFWKHYEIVTGKRGPSDTSDCPYTCSC